MPTPPEGSLFDSAFGFRRLPVAMPTPPVGGLFDPAFGFRRPRLLVDLNWFGLGEGQR